MSLSATNITPDNMSTTLPRENHKNILVIEDNDFDKSFLKELLKDTDDEAYNLVFASSIGVALMRAKLQPFDLILLDYHLPDGTAPEFISNFKEFLDIPIIVLTGYNLKMMEDTSLVSGAMDYIPKDDLTEGLLKRSIRFALERQKELSEIKERSLTDPLTGCYNRYALEGLFKNNFVKAKNKDFVSAFLMIDFDGFKKLNDQHGHVIGDEALKLVAQSLTEFGKERAHKDFLIRFGGDEFIYLTTGHKDKIELINFAERIIEKHKKPFILNGEENLLPLSIGISVFGEHGADHETLIKQADAALYRAKKMSGASYEFAV